MTDDTADSIGRHHDFDLRVRPVPSQSPQPDHPASLYVRFGLDGMSAGRLPDFEYSRHLVSDFSPKLRANSRASLKDRY